MKLTSCRTGIDSKKDAKEEAERKLVKDALDSPALTKVREIYGDVSDRRLEGTGQWIIDEPLFRAWIKKEAPIVWILGGPGAGKSFLSSKIISHLQEIYPQDPQYPSRVSIGYFYIKEDNQQLRSLNTILKSIAFQIASNDPVYRKYAVNVCNNPDQISSARGTWKRLFTDFFGSAQYRDNSTVIVIDGLDEAPKTERESLLRLLRDLEDSPDPASRARIQIALVGRPELRDDIFSAWDQRIIFIEVSAMKNTADIASYIKSRIPRVKILKNVHLSPATRAELRKEIDDKLTEGANGMFLWVNLMLDQIYNKSRPSDIRAALKDAPRDLAKMIRHVFERLANDPNVEKDDLNEMLAWVTCAQRPLLLGELDVILKLRPPVGEGMPDLEDRLRGQFASFFTLTREDNLTTEGLQHRARQAIHSKQESHIQDGDDKDQDSQAANQSEDDFDAEEGFQSDFKTTIIQFSHASIKDYLVQEGKPDMRKWPADLGIGIEMNRAEQHIVKTCLSILCDKNHGTDFEAPNLSDYAADHFMEHLVLLDKSAASETNRRAIRRSLFLLFNSESPLETWINKASDVCETFLTIWLGDSKYRECVRGWFAEEDASDDQFSDEEILWMQKAGKSDKELFRPLAMLCATRWLKEINVDPAFYVWVLHIYLAMVSNPLFALAYTSVQSSVCCS